MINNFKNMNDISSNLCEISLAINEKFLLIELDI